MSKAKAAGRPSKDKESEAPMPKSWKDTERLAGVLAYLEASEGGANAALEEDARDKFAAQMDYVHSNVKEFVESKHKWGKGHGQYIYTLEESKKRRPFTADNAMVENFKLTRRVCNNVISPVYNALHGSDGKAETGTNREKIIQQILDQLVPAEDLTADTEGTSGGGGAPIDVENEEAADGGADEEAGPNKTGKAGVKSEKKPSEKKPNAHVLECMTTWLHLGPLAQEPERPNPQFMMTVPNGSRKADIRKPTGRQAQRDEILESLKGKRTKKVGGAGTDAEGLELRKVAALEKLEQGERKKRKLGMHAVLCKRAEEAFDSQVSRLEKLAAMTKDKVRKLAYENKVAELLEAGPTMPDPEPDSEQEEQEEGEEAEEEEGAEDL